MKLKLAEKLFTVGEYYYRRKYYESSVTYYQMVETEYADTPWAPKALLAAAEVSLGEGDRAWLRGRLDAYGDSPYVLAARGGSGAGFEALEEELGLRLQEMRGR